MKSTIYTEAIKFREKSRKALLYLRPTNSTWREANNKDWSTPLGCYPVDFEIFLETGQFKLRDETGLPVSYRRNWIRHDYTNLCGWALANWGRWLRIRDDRHIAPVLQVSKYILRTAHRFDDEMLLRDEIPGLGHVGPLNAMAQGEAISVLLRSYQVTRQELFLEGALRCLGPFYRSVDEGGLVSHDFGNPWFEEYPARPLGHVLNGMIFAVWGLCDLAALAPQSGANLLAMQGLNSLEALCRRFDLNWWSAYSVGENSARVASISYHGLHIAQFRALKNQTGLPIFGSLADRFEHYGRDLTKRARSALKMLGRNIDGSGLVG